MIFTCATCFLTMSEVDVRVIWKYFVKIVVFCVESMLDIKLNVTEMWKKTIIDKKIETNLVLKSDLSCDLSERRYSQKT